MKLFFRNFIYPLSIDRCECVLVEPDQEDISDLFITNFFNKFFLKKCNFFVDEQNKVVMKTYFSCLEDINVEPVNAMLCVNKQIIALNRFYSIINGRVTMLNSTMPNGTIKKQAITSYLTKINKLISKQTTTNV